MHQPDESLDHSRLEQLIAARCYGTLSSAEREELDRILTKSSQARTLYWESMSVHAGLCWMHRGKLECDNRLAELGSEEVGASADAAPARRHRTFVGHWKHWLPLTIAAMLLFVVWMEGRQRSEHRQPNLNEQAATLTGRRDVLGTLTPLSADCRWSFGTPGKKNRAEFKNYDTLWLDRGAVELSLTNGTVAQLEAPLILEMVSIDRARVLRGRVTVTVSDGAKGFTVETAAAQIIDHGTTFSVDVVESGNTDVVVFQGAVDVNYVKHNPEAGTHGLESTRRLRSGEAARVNQDGTLSRIVNVRRTDFSDGRIGSSIMKEVRDNVVREKTMKYYEIVAGGMQEDALAFVDRDYQWNGVDANGIPDYLLGADYVKTFNDDKVVPDLVITISFEGPAMLYLLVDDRLRQTDWLTSQFEDTGDNIGVDEGHHFPNDVRRLDRGPGVSIDQVHSIWKRRVARGETISIGPLGPLSPEASIRGTKASLNMYGIVAVPLQSGKVP